MGGTKGYRSYRGRTSKGKIALAVLLPYLRRLRQMPSPVPKHP